MTETPDYRTRRLRQAPNLAAHRNRLGTIVWPKGPAAWALLSQIAELDPTTDYSNEEIVARLRARGELTQARTVAKIRREAP